MFFLAKQMNEPLAWINHGYIIYRMVNLSRCGQMIATSQDIAEIIARGSVVAVTGRAMIRLLIVLDYGCCWLWDTCNPSNTSSHLVTAVLQAVPYVSERA